ncbi:hypothetical protein BDZ85DRAFT_41975 [Elsinoe ampelina]|uniref:AA1-like domain-containing protein n=1 Tax=Elsinoe ampelina TaxID=302913 RepID=A0A6A6G1X6_9PEZI|nr:hypothetical protein BDZ85DRAFT_41975 [Elsinoe ampelina]
MSWLLAICSLLATIQSCTAESTSMTSNPPDTSPSPTATLSAFTISNLTSFRPRARLTTKLRSRISFTFSDPTVPNGVDVATCELAWSSSADQYAYHVPDYTRCSNPFFGFRISNKTYNGPGTFRLNLQHAYQVNKSDSEWTTFFANLTLGPRRMRCSSTSKGTTCRQKTARLTAPITSSAP